MHWLWENNGNILVIHEGRVSWCYIAIHFRPKRQYGADMQESGATDTCCVS